MFGEKIREGLIYNKPAAVPRGPDLANPFVNAGVGAVPIVPGRS